MLNDPQFETLTPSQFITFTIPNTLNHRCHLHTPKLRIAVVDSPVAVTDDVHPNVAAMNVPEQRETEAVVDDVLPKVGAMIVPEQRETDWTFCTESGQLQLLLKFYFHGISRLILIGNDLALNPEPCIYIRPPVTDTADRKKLEDELQQLVADLTPKVCFQNGMPRIVFLPYEDDMLYRESIAKFLGAFVGEFVVEDVELESNGDSKKKLRRRLKFKRTPDLLQSQVALIPVLDDGEINTELNLESLRKMKNVKFEVDISVLVQPYLIPMVSGLFLIASHLNERIQQKITPRALCLGVGGGALLSFLNTQLGFEVVGVEADEAVLNAANQYFGFNKEKSIKVIVEDAIDLIQNSATKGEEDAKIDGLDGKFDVVMVDLDSSEARNGICSPPLEFIEKSVIHGVRLLLHDHGVVIINVVPLDLDDGEKFYLTLIKELKDAFHKVYEIDVKNEDNFVLMATVSPSPSSNDFLEKLRSVIPADYMNMNMESLNECV